MTRVFIAAPTATVRAGLRALLAQAPVEVVGESAGLAGALARLPSVDAVVLDEQLLAEAARLLTGEAAPALVVLSDDERSAALLRELPVRGWGVVPLDTASEELHAALLAAAQGLVVLPRPLAGRLLSQRAVTEVQQEPLTAREREVLELLGQGLPNKLIARQLHISEHTVKFHISSIYTKLGASSRTEAISRGARRGLITL